jgi:hypothetical protein
MVLRGVYSSLQRDMEIETVEEDEDNKEGAAEVDIINPDKDIKKRLTIVADIVKKFAGGYEKTRQTVKKQLREIIHIAKNEYGMEPIHVRDLIYQAFAERGISRRYLRKLLPDMFKDASKIPRSHKHKQEIKQQQEQQALQLQQQGIAPAQDDNMHSNNTEAEAETMSPPALYTTIPEETFPFMKKSDTGLLKEELRKAHVRIEKLEKELQVVKEPFTVKTFLHKRKSFIPIVAKIDPVRKTIISIQPKW